MLLKLFSGIAIISGIGGYYAITNYSNTKKKIVTTYSEKQKKEELLKRQLNELYDNFDYKAYIVYINDQKDSSSK